MARQGITWQCLTTCAFFRLSLRDIPESPNFWSSTLPRSSGSVSVSIGEEGVVTVGDAEVKLRKSKKKKKRSSMIFITEERERTSTLDCKRVRVIGCRTEQRIMRTDTWGGGLHVNGRARKFRAYVQLLLSFLWSLSPSSCPRSRNSAVTPTCVSKMMKMCRWPTPTLDPCQPSQVTLTHRFIWWYLNRKSWAERKDMTKRIN